jgi:hypothetical protein
VPDLRAFGGCEPIAHDGVCAGAGAGEAIG